MIALWLWWYGQMASLLPGRRKRTGQRLALWREDGLSLLERRGNSLVEIEPETGSMVTLRLADRRPWRRHLSLPRAAAPFLRQILRNEMDRRTPWQADQIYFTASVEKGEEPGQIAVTLSVLPRLWANPALASLAARGLRAVGIQLEEDGPTLSLDQGEPLADMGNSRKPAIILAAAASVALLSIILQTFWISALDARLSEARREAAATRVLASEADTLRRRQHFPGVQREENPSAIAVLNRVSRVLPDDSWLDETEIKGRQLVLGGISAEPAKLLALLQAGGFAEVEFAAPVTPAEGGGQHFQIRAKIIGTDHEFR